MSSKHRCKVCEHALGPRRVLTRGPSSKGTVGIVKKAGCSHECHNVVEKPKKKGKSKAKPVEEETTGAEEELLGETSEVWVEGLQSH